VDRQKKSKREKLLASNQANPDEKHGREINPVEGEVRSNGPRDRRGDCKRGVECLEIKNEGKRGKVDHPLGASGRPPQERVVDGDQRPRKRSGGSWMGKQA
jgi:hypothetical protein